MKYIILIVVICIVIFLFIYPFKITLHNESNYFYINIGNLMVFKLNILLLLDKVRNKQIKIKASNTKLIKKLKFKEIDIKLTGLSLDYKLNGVYFGGLYALVGFLKIFFQCQNVSFNYDLKYIGDESLQFKSIVRARAYSVIEAINKL